MPRTPGAKNLSVRELDMKVDLAKLKRDNKALKEALRAAQKAAAKK